MKLLIFTVFDQKAEAYLQPFFSQTVGTGIRAFATAAQDEGHDFHRNAADYTLFELGHFDQSTGMFFVEDVPKTHGSAINFRTLNTDI